LHQKFQDGKVTVDEARKLVEAGMVTGLPSPEDAMVAAASNVSPESMQRMLEEGKITIEQAEKVLALQKQAATRSASAKSEVTYDAQEIEEMLLSGQISVAEAKKMVEDGAFASGNARPNTSTYIHPTTIYV
jgi:tape measure domain-containing protein